MKSFLLNAKIWEEEEEEKEYKKKEERETQYWSQRYRWDMSSYRLGPSRHPKLCPSCRRSTIHNDL
jgi:hypothetical protein